MFNETHPIALSGACHNIARALEAARRILNEEGDDAERRAEAVAIRLHLNRRPEMIHLSARGQLL